MLVTTEGVDTEGAEQSVLRLANRAGAEIIVVDSIRTPFHLPSFGTASTEITYDVAMKVKQAYLEKVAMKYREAGLSAKTQVLLSSRSSKDIVHLATSEGCDLVVRYLKGEHSRVQQRFGQTAKNLMRVCPCPLLLVEHAIAEDPKVLACVSAEHGIEENQVILDAASQLAKTIAQMHVLSCWRIEPAYYLSDDADPTYNEPSRKEVQLVLNALRADLSDKYDLASFGSRLHVINGDPIDVIPEYSSVNNFDVSVMSAASLNHPLGRLLGSTIENTIEKMTCGLLVIKPKGFESPLASKKLSQQV